MNKEQLSEKIVSKCLGPDTQSVWDTTATREPPDCVGQENGEDVCF